MIICIMGRIYVVRWYFVREKRGYHLNFQSQVYVYIRKSACKIQIKKNEEKKGERKNTHCVHDGTPKKIIVFFCLFNSHFRTSALSLSLSHSPIHPLFLYRFRKVVVCITLIKTVYHNSILYARKNGHCQKIMCEYFYVSLFGGLEDREMLRGE